MNLVVQMLTVSSSIVKCIYLAVLYFGDIGGSDKSR